VSVAPTQALRRTAFAVAMAVIASGTLATVVTTLPGAAQTVPRCSEADVKMVSKIDSAFAVAGDSFTFKMTQRVPAKGNVPEIALGTRGYGVVSYADHAHGSGSPGRLVVEPRFFALLNGTHVPVMADPQLSEAFVQGETRNLNGAFSFVPGFGLAVGGYNALHRGKEVVIEKGTTFRVILGDDLAAAQCFVPPPSAPDVR